jgi:hypothetical protein
MTSKRQPTLEEAIDHLLTVFCGSNAERHHTREEIAYLAMEDPDLMPSLNVTVQAAKERNGLELPPL